MLLDLLSHCAGWSPAFGTKEKTSHRKMAFLFSSSLAMTVKMASCFQVSGFSLFVFLR
jgi:hypothetical protein